VCSELGFKVLNLRERGRAWVVERTETRVVMVSAEVNFMIMVEVDSKKWW